MGHGIGPEQLIVVAPSAQKSCPIGHQESPVRQPLRKFLIFEKLHHTVYRPHRGIGDVGEFPHTPWPGKIE